MVYNYHDYMVIHVYMIYTILYIYIPRRTLRHFFLPSAPRQPHRHFHPEVCKTRQIYIDVGIFISRCFFVLRHHFVLRHFYPEVRLKNLESRRKNPESRRKKTELGGILFETFFCTEQHDKTIQNLSASAFFLGLGIYSGNRQK